MKLTFCVVRGKILIVEQTLEYFCKVNFHGWKKYLTSLDYPDETSVSRGVQEDWGPRRPENLYDLRNPPERFHRPGYRPIDDNVVVNFPGFPVSIC